MKPGTKKKLSVDDFINSPKVAASLHTLQEAFAQNGGTPIVSDVLDADGNQYVNLVQKGGGVLGVALVGYTYVLEKMGIRFLRLAGTSAGAINTAMVTVIGNKNEEKSTRVLDAITKLNFFNLVDGHPVARWLIKKFITHKTFFRNGKALLISIVAIYLLLLAGSFTLLWLLQYNEGLLTVTKTLVVLLIALTLILGGLGWYTRSLLRKLKSSGYGVNPGNFFYKWMKDRMHENGVDTVDELIAKAGQEIPGAHLRTPHPEGVEGLNGNVTFIASELVTQNKIEFPAMCKLFRPPGDMKDLHPAGFVRASMSIPIFFESFFIENIDHTNAAIREAWMDAFMEQCPPAEARFVDGGILSNFPISLFYNPNIVVPRLPTFGIDLDDSAPEDNSQSPDAWTFMGYFGRIFNTIRNYYDKDFQIKNKTYSLGIGTIPLSEFNWLNFFLTDQEKLTMFEKGAEAATKFLLSFDWEKYKDDRASMQQTLQMGK